MNAITSTPLRTLIAAVILSALAVSVPTVSSAEEGASLPHVTVKFADLDASSSQGAAALYRRIRSTANSICWRMSDSNEAFKSNKDACLQKVIADAVIKVNEPALSAVFASEYGVAAPMVLAAAGVR